MVVERRLLSLGFMLSFMLSFMLLLLVAATPTWAVTCGDTIGPHEVAILTNDLTCDAGNTPSGTALTLVGPKALLKLSGHTVTCGEGVDRGIKLEGSGAILIGGLQKHGTITGCRDGVDMREEGHHLVTKVTARNNAIGFLFSSHDNELRLNQGLNNELNGFHFNGAERKTLKANLALGNGAFGFIGIGANDTT